MATGTPSGDAPRRRNLTRAPNASAAYGIAGARMTAADIAHAAETWLSDARGVWRDNLDAPLYEGDGVPSDVERDP